MECKKHHVEYGEYKCLERVFDATRREAAACRPTIQKLIDNTDLTPELRKAAAVFMSKLVMYGV